MVLINKLWYFLQDYNKSTTRLLSQLCCHFLHMNYSNFVMYCKIVSQDCFVTRFKVKFDARNHLCKIENCIFLSEDCSYSYDQRNLPYIVKTLASNLMQESEDQTRFININDPQDCLDSSTFLVNPVIKCNQHKYCQHSCWYPTWNNLAISPSCNEICLMATILISTILWVKKVTILVFCPALTKLALDLHVNFCLCVFPSFQSFFQGV